MQITVTIQFRDEAEYQAWFARGGALGKPHTVGSAEGIPDSQDTPEPRTAPPPVREDERPAGGRALPKVEKRGRPPYKKLRDATGIQERALLSRAWRASGGDFDKAVASLQTGKLVETGPKGAPTMDHVKAVVKAFVGAHGTPALMKRLQEANVTRVTELKDEKLIRFLDALAADTPETLDGAMEDGEGANHGDYRTASDVAAANGE